MARIPVNRRRKGLATVEMALILPLLLLLVFGVIEYSWMFLKASQVADAARRGARYAIRPGVISAAQVTDPTYDPTPPSIALLNLAGIPVDSETVTVPTGVAPGSGNIVTVRVAVPYTDVNLLGLPFLPMPEQIEASVSMAKEGL